MDIKPNKIIKYKSEVSVSNTSESRESEYHEHVCNQILLVEDNPNILKKYERTLKAMKVK